MKPLEKWMKKENLGVLLLIGLLLLVIALPVKKNEEEEPTKEGICPDKSESFTRGLADQDGKPAGPGTGAGPGSGKSGGFSHL